MIRCSHDEKISASNHDQNIPVCDRRCCCGKLLAKQTKEGIKIKCGRCKREVLIKLDETEYDAVGSL